MPELPEVETVKRILEQQIVGCRIVNVIINNPQVVAYPSAQEFRSRIKEQKVNDIRRRGKFIIIELEDEERIILHLRMTGCLLVTPCDYPMEKHTHLCFALDDGKELRFEDMRRFGRFWLLRKGENDIYSGIEKLGIEPSDGRLTGEYLQKFWGKKKKAIKGCLLDQNVVCGIGNIYSDEILFTSKIRPSRPANSLTEAEWNVLADAIRQQISYFIEKNAVSAGEYFKGKGKEYRNTPFFRVYGHANEPCGICGTILKKQVVGGRSSVFCPECQREG